MDCKTALALLEPYLDGELARAESRELETHLEHCAECRVALERLDAVRQSLRDPGLRHAAPAELRERIRLAARAATGAERSRPRRALAWLGLAAASVLAFVIGGASMQWWQSGRADSAAQRQLGHDLFAAHWRALAANAPFDVASSDRHTVKPWFAGKLADSPPVRDFANDGFALIGGRVDYVGDRRVAVLVYRHGGHVIDVFVLPAGERLPMPARANGYEVQPVMLDGQPAAAVSDMDAAELARFVRLLSAPP